jgi:hypothetical protein
VHEHDGDVDRLEADAPSRATAAVVAVVVVLLAAVVALTLAGRPAHHRHAARPILPLPTPSPVTTTPTGPEPAIVREGGSVFLEHLAACTRTDHLNRLRLAFAVTNLSNHPLRILSASFLGRVSGLRLTHVQIGAAPCADARAPHGVRLSPAHAAVVALSFAVGPQCPDDGIIAARVTIDAEQHILHADSSALTDLQALHFAECG